MLTWRPSTLKRGAHIVGHLGLKGISFKPHPKCESVSLFFNSSGKLRDPMGVVLISEGSLKPEDAWIAVKTQFAGGVGAMLSPISLSKTCLYKKTRAFNACRWVEADTLRWVAR